MIAANQPLTRADCAVWTIARLSAMALPHVWRWVISAGDATISLSDSWLELALEGLFGAPG